MSNDLKLYIFILNIKSQKLFFSRRLYDPGHVKTCSTHHSVYGDVRHVISNIIPYSSGIDHSGGNRDAIQLYCIEY